MWIPFNNKDLDNQQFKNYPPEGCEIMTTDGQKESIMWFIMSSEYKWFYQEDPNHPDRVLTDDELPFQPTHWMLLEDYTLYKRDKQIDNILN